MWLAEERNTFNHPEPFHISDIGYIFVQKVWSPEQEGDVAGSQPSSNVSISVKPASVQESTG